MYDHGSQNISYPRRYTERSLRTFRIWHEEWGEQASRVKRVLATQTGYNWVSEQILAHAKGEFDYFSPTFYFGYSGACLDNLRALGAAATTTDVIDCTRQSMQAFFPLMRQTYRLGQLYSKPFAHYEGGQHMTSNPVVEPFQQALYASQIDPQIRSLYQEMIDSLRRYGGTAYAVAFSFTGPRESNYGSWGHLEDIDQDTSVLPAPKYQVLLDNFRGAQGSCNLNTSTALPQEHMEIWQEQLSGHSFSIHPNPAGDQIFLKNADGKNLEIFNTLGQRVLHIERLIDPVLNISHLKNGVYFIKVGDEVQRLVKQ